MVVVKIMDGIFKANCRKYACAFEMLPTGEQIDIGNPYIKKAIIVKPVHINQ